MKFCEGIMVWKHIDNIHMVPTSTKELVINMDKVKSIKEIMKSNMDTKDEKVVRKKSYTDIVIHRNKIWKT